MKSTKISHRSPLTIDVDRRIFNETTLVLAGYVILAAVSHLATRSSLQAGLAVLLAVLGPGASTAAVFFPHPRELDFAERSALSACLSLTIGGLLGFGLSRSTWGLNLESFLVASLAYNFVCYWMLLYRRRHLAEEERLLRLDTGLLIAGFRRSRTTSHLVTAGLSLLLLAGIGMLVHRLAQPFPDPPMTEFFLLGLDGQAHRYPKTIPPGGVLSVLVGITNRENEAADYHILVAIAGTNVHSTSPVSLGTDETYTGSLEVGMPTAQNGPVKVDVILMRDGQAYRNLHLWVEVPRTGMEERSIAEEGEPASRTYR